MELGIKGALEGLLEAVGDGLEAPFAVGSSDRKLASDLIVRY